MKTIEPLILTANTFKITVPFSSTTHTPPRTPASASYPVSPVSTANTSPPTSPSLKAKFFPIPEEPRHLQDPRFHSYLVGVRLIVPGRKSTLAGRFEEEYRVTVWVPPTPEEVAELRAKERWERETKERRRREVREVEKIVDWSGVEGLWRKEDEKSGAGDVDAEEEREMWEVTARKTKLKVEKEKVKEGVKVLKLLEVREEGK